MRQEHTSDCAMNNGPAYEPQPCDCAGYLIPETQEEAIGLMKMDGDADPEGTARLNYPKLFTTNV